MNADDLDTPPGHLKQHPADPGIHRCGPIDFAAFQFRQESGQNHLIILVIPLSNTISLESFESSYRGWCEKPSLIVRYWQFSRSDSRNLQNWPVVGAEALPGPPASHLGMTAPDKAVMTDAG
jgi:hypothetical protein